MWLSIVIPVYNAEQYLERCLESILAGIEGGIRGAEVILVNNNSADNSLAIARKWRSKYPEILKIVNCATPGAAAARNLGAKRAKGDYLWFIDADDYIAKNALKKLHAATAGKPDLVMFGAEKLDRKGDKQRYLSAVTPDEPDYRSRFVRYGMGPWQVLIRRKLWTEQQFSFREGIIHEDMELMSALILYCKKYAAVNVPLYYYCDNPGSVLHGQAFRPQIFDIFTALEGLYRRFEKAGAVEQYRSELEWFFIWNLLIDSAVDFRAFPEGRVGFQRSRRMLGAYFPHWWKNRFLRTKPLKFRVKCWLGYWGI